VIVVNSLVGVHNVIKHGVPERKIHHAPNSVDTDLFRPGTDRNSGPFTVICVARLSHEKRVDRFIRAFKTFLCAAESPARAWIVGDGPDRLELEKLAGELKIPQGALTFTGIQANVLSFYQHSDVLVLPSDIEGHPNVVLEAMSCGMPCIVTPAGDAKELVAHGETGYVTGFDATEISEKLVLMASSPDLVSSMGARARKFAQGYQLSLLPDKLAGIYNI
jgi:glycosyltransferase involved in cell wall biosynthesis